MHTLPASERWNWAPLAEDPTIIHVWPHLDVVLHVATPECVCKPYVQPMKFQGEVIGSYVVHRHHYLMN